MKLPSMPFYPGDWLKDVALRRVSPAARGLWIDILCFMWESPRRGYLDGFPPYRSKNSLALINNCKEKGSGLDRERIGFGSGLDRVWSGFGSGKDRKGKSTRSEFVFRKMLGKLCGLETKAVTKLLAELDDAEIFSVTEDGVIYNRRMAKDEAKRIVCTELGRKGGNPNLVNRLVGGTVNPTLNGQELRPLTLPLTVMDKGEDKGVDKGRARASVSVSLTHNNNSPITCDPSVSAPDPAPPPAGGSQATAAEPKVDIEDLRLAERLKSLILANDKNARLPKNLTAWGMEAERMRRIDGRSNEEILQVMKWSQADPFWRANILSMAQLRSKFTALKLKMTTPGGSNGAGQSRGQRVVGAAAPVPGKYDYLSEVQEDEKA